MRGRAKEVVNMAPKKIYEETEVDYDTFLRLLLVILFISQATLLYSTLKQGNLCFDWKSKLYAGPI